MSSRLRTPILSYGADILDEIDMRSAAFVSALFTDCFIYSEYLSELDDREYLKRMFLTIPKFNINKARNVFFSDKSERVMTAMKLSRNSSDRTVDRIFVGLVKAEILDQHKPTIYEIRGIIRAKRPQSSSNSIFDKVCSWCGANTAILHGHHFPIPQCDGGEKIVNICPNCHYEFHTMENSKFYSATEKFLGYMQANNEVY